MKNDIYGSVIPPIYATSTFRMEELGRDKGYDYTRCGNPTRAALEETLAVLEGGCKAWATASGMAAESTVMFLFKPGDHVIVGKEVYGGTFRLFRTLLEPMGYDFSFVDMSDLQEVEDAVRPKTRCIWIETPSNPLLSLVDLEGVVGLARKHGVVTVADNTFCSPCVQKPLEYGVDLVIHSTTKYINGHSDIVGGAIVAREETYCKGLDHLFKTLGTGQAPMDAWLTLRGLRTLSQRMKSHQKNAQIVAEFLQEHTKVDQVYYPGLPQHPQHELARKQMRGFGGIVTIDLDTHYVDVATFLSRLDMFSFAVSLGGVESLVEHVWSMSHAGMTPEAKKEAGIGRGTVRLSMGIEHPDDLVGDLAQALSIF